MKISVYRPFHKGLKVGAVSITIALVMTLIFSYVYVNQGTSLPVSMLGLVGSFTFLGMSTILFSTVERFTLWWDVRADIGSLYLNKGQKRVGKHMLALSLGFGVVYIITVINAELVSLLAIVVMAGALMVAVAFSQDWFISRGISLGWITFLTPIALLVVCIVLGQHQQDAIQLTNNLIQYGSKVVMVPSVSETSLRWISTPQIWGQLMELSALATFRLPDFWVISAGVCAVYALMLAVRQVLVTERAITVFIELKEKQ